MGLRMKAKGEKIKHKSGRFQVLSETLGPGIGGTHGQVLLVTKKKKDGTYSTYISKTVGTADPFLSSAEAAMGDCYQFIAPKISPKVRVVHGEYGKPLAV